MFNLQLLAFFVDNMTKFAQGKKLCIGFIGYIDKFDILFGLFTYCSFTSRKKQ